MDDVVCVLGASGFVGSSILKYLKANNIPAFGISRSSDSEDIYRLEDYRDTDRFAALLDSCTVVVNAVGSYKPKDFSADIEGPFNELGVFAKAVDAALARVDIKRFVHISSAGTIYGHGSGSKHHESDVTVPVTWYGRIKLLEESYYAQICRRHGVDFIAARVTNPFGNTRPKRHGFVDVLARSVLDGSFFHTFGTNIHKRDFIHVDDMSRMIAGLCSASLESSSEIFNIGSGCSYSLYELATLVDGLCGNVVFDLTGDGTDIDVVDICTEKVFGVLGNKWSMVPPDQYLLGIINSRKGFVE